MRACIAQRNIRDCVITETNTVITDFNKDMEFGAVNLSTAKGIPPAGRWR